MENLDALDKEELLDRFVIPEIPTIARKENMSIASATLYQQYAVKKHVAIVCQLYRQIREANIFETMCNEIYNSLPAKERW